MIETFLDMIGVEGGLILLAICCVGVPIAGMLYAYLDYRHDCKVHGKETANEIWRRWR